MTSSINILIPTERSSAKLAISKQLSCSVGLLLCAACVSAIAPDAAIAKPILETEAPTAYEIPLYESPLDEVQTLPGAAALRIKEQLVENQAVEVYPVVVEPALAATIYNGELADTAEPFPLLLTQIENDTTEPRSEFGEKGQTRWFLQAGAGTEGDGESLGFLGGGASYFFAKGHSVNLALNGMAFDLPDKDPVGINLDFLVRSHWIRGDNWSLYIDGGAGILVSTSRVPNGGSSFNFTPQGGLGASINVNKKKDQRLLLGVRYHHISNANTFEANPGLDTYMGYVGMTFPIR